ncbi:hypothetical protein C882_3290 [Caenispirillum salinarum AK4]|uniref:BrnT family toxin n=1 Tax=Caenispirillum salinarum AK4 TaxID=1238182 RepID=K9HVH4_9PROT|nr:hypothetical protein C882_3290 [Caenispirillum salinarum AK4]
MKADDRQDYGEDRFIATGCIEGRFVTLVFTIREPNVCRIISARGASRDERETYQQARLEKG